MFNKDKRLINILDKINNCGITLGETYDVMEDTIEKFHCNKLQVSIPEELCLEHFHV